MNSNTQHTPGPWYVTMKSGRVIRFGFSCADNARLEREIHEYSAVVADESKAELTRELAQKAVWARMQELDARAALAKAGA